MPKVKCPYTFPHRSRKARVDYITGIGGYARSHEGVWPIEFNVACYDAEFSFDHIWKEYSKEHVPSECTDNPILLAAYYNLAQSLHEKHEECMWEWGQEDAARSLDKEDSDYYQQLWDGTPVDVTLELRGRGGKHLVIAKFEGRDFSRISDDDLRDEMMRQTRPDGYEHVEYETLRSGNEWTSWTDKQVEILYKYVRMCEQDFTPQKASKEVEYQGAFCLFANIVGSEWENCKKNIEDHEGAVEAAQALYSALGGEGSPAEIFSSLCTLCAAAGVLQEEMQG